ncbi:uncharacterized protein LOC130614168 [Hydractinia symbiolongicarpus]|uniref:uncharacterized protein LOC130614168 n=1 Tax=Hydractinia symbiolongicarpus TaxID=13093 RepID=UPI00254CC30B|nr:uncharacterized protein LOC130614168 [Hydractinia symbiolongicarpus]
MLNSQERILHWRRRIRFVVTLQILLGVFFAITSAFLWTISSTQTQLNITETLWASYFLIGTGISTLVSYIYLRNVCVQKLSFTFGIILTMVISMDICLTMGSTLSHNVCPLHLMYQTQYNGEYKLVYPLCLYVKMARDMLCLFSMCLSLGIIITAPSVDVEEKIKDNVKNTTIIPDGKA